MNLENSKLDLLLKPIDIRLKTLSDNYVFQIDSSKVLEITKGETTTYTFPTITSDCEKTTNYILSVTNNVSKEYFIKYDENLSNGKIINPENGEEVDSNSTMTTCTFSIEREVCVCEGHSPENCNGCSGGFTTVTSVYEYPYFSSGGGGISGGTDGGNTGGGSGLGGSEGSLPNLPEAITMPVKTDKECKKLQETFDRNETYYEKIIELTNKVSDSVEHVVNLFENNSIEEASGFGESSTVLLNSNPTSRLKSNAHSHNETEKIKTYSVMSIEDLSNIGKYYYKNKLDIDNFTAFLTTAKGTNLAITISNKSKFKEFFKFLYVFPEYSNGDQTKFQECVDKIAAYNELNEKYYDNPDAIIKVENTNNVALLTAFVQYIEEGDMGFTVFESNSDFTEFIKLSINKITGNLDRKNCNEN